MISIIMPVYNEGDQIYANVVKVMTILTENNIEHNFVLVDDGSSDNSWQSMQSLCKDYDNIFIIRFSRNFGKEAALCAGLDNATGDACIVLDADLQHPPTLIPEMVRLWQNEGYDVVEGIKSNRGKETFLSKLTALTFYNLFYKMSGIDLNSASDFKLLDKKVVDAMKSMHESITFFRGMSAWVGFNRIQIPFEVQERKSGNSKWSIKSLTNLAMQSITSFSSAPLYIVTYLGFFMLIADFILLIQTLYMKFSGKALTGFTTIIILLLGIGSFLMISLGIIGFYLSKIYDEIKKRPRYLIAKKQGKRCTNE